MGVFSSMLSFLFFHFSCGGVNRYSENVCVLECVVRGHMQYMLFRFCGSKENFLMFVSWFFVYFKKNHSDTESSAWHFTQDSGQITRANDECLLGSAVVFVDKSCCNVIDSDVSTMFLRLRNVSFKERVSVNVCVSVCVCV